MLSVLQDSILPQLDRVHVFSVRLESFLLSGRLFATLARPPTIHSAILVLARLVTPARIRRLAGKVLAHRALLEPSLPSELRVS